MLLAQRSPPARQRLRGPKGRCSRRRPGARAGDPTHRGTAPPPHRPHHRTMPRRGRKVGRGCRRLDGWGERGARNFSAARERRRGSEGWGVSVRATRLKLPPVRSGCGTSSPSPAGGGSATAGRRGGVLFSVSERPRSRHGRLTPPRCRSAQATLPLQGRVKAAPGPPDRVFDGRSPIPHPPQRAVRRKLRGLMSGQVRLSRSGPVRRMEQAAAAAPLGKRCPGRTFIGTA